MNCDELIRLTGRDSKYHRDCQLRAVQSVPFSEALTILGLPADLPELVIQAGIGTLVMRPGFASFTPTPTMAQKAGGVVGAAIESASRLMSGDPVASSTLVRESRLVICRACPLWDVAGERCRSCGCNGTAKASLAGSRCPEGRWEAQGAS